MWKRQQSCLVGKDRETRLFELFSASLYSEALVELSAWPEGLERSWYEGTCYYYLQNYARAEHVFRILNGVPGIPAEVPLRLAISLQCQDCSVEALGVLLPVFTRARIDSSHLAVEALILYGNICLEIGFPDHFKKVVSKFSGFLPLSPELRFLDALVSLFVGDFQSGWTAYEARLDIWWGKLPALPAPLLTSASWVDCQHLVLFAEAGQGLGDVLWGLRCVPLLKRFGASVSFVAPAGLVPLLADTGLFDAVSDAFDGLSVKPTHCLPVMSSPSLLGLTHPGEMPSPEIRLGARQDAFRFCDGLSASQIAGLSRPVVALNWQGNQSQEGPMSAGIRGRSFDCSEFETVTALRECLLMSVQVGESAKQIKDSWLKSCLHPAQDALDLLDRDFLLTAEVLLQCDVLITNDTSVAHLGGLLNIPTWVVLKCFPYWQWGDQGQHNVWYPSIRCFRQHSPGDWKSAMEDVNEALTSLLQDLMLHPETPESPGL